MRLKKRAELLATPLFANPSEDADGKMGWFDRSAFAGLYALDDLAHEAEGAFHPLATLFQRLEVRNCRSLDLCEGNLAAEDQGAHDGVSQRQDDIEIFVHVAVMQNVVAIETEENSGPLDVPVPRLVHAIVQVFVSHEVTNERDRRAPAQRPDACGSRNKQEGEHAKEENDRAVPPSHGDQMRLAIFLAVMIGVVCLESLVMHHGMGLERIVEFANGTVHDILVQCPFKEGGEDNASDGTNGHPEENIFHVLKK